MLKNCPACKAGLKPVTKRKVFNFRNPGQVPIVCAVYECPKCGEEYMDEEQSLAAARQLDDALKSERKVRIKPGSILV
ncbi:MAG: hypothetical protein ABIA12_02360 [Candidatus Aenigmatarchaeota archaeon]